MQHVYIKYNILKCKSFQIAEYEINMKISKVNLNCMKNFFTLIIPNIRIFFKF